VLGHVAQHQRDQHAPPEGHRRIDAQRAAAAGLRQAGQAFGVLHLAQDGLAALVVERAGLGGRDAARGAVQQARARWRSASATALVAVGWVVPSSAAALLKLPVSTTRTKICMA
jgi:hypothetical protein